MTQSFAEMFAESLVHQEMNRGAVVTGTVVDIQSDSVIVHAGLKSEGVIPIGEFKNASGELEVAVGDEVEVFKLQQYTRGIKKDSSYEAKNHL